MNREEAVAALRAAMASNSTELFRLNRVEVPLDALTLLVNCTVDRETLAARLQAIAEREADDGGLISLWARIRERWLDALLAGPLAPAGRPEGDGDEVPQATFDEAIKLYEKRGVVDTIEFAYAAGRAAAPPAVGGDAANGPHPVVEDNSAVGGHVWREVVCATCGTKDRAAEGRKDEADSLALILPAGWWSLVQHGASNRGLGDYDSQPVQHALYCRWACVPAAAVGGDAEPGGWPALEAALDSLPFLSASAVAAFVPDIRAVLAENKALRAAAPPGGEGLDRGVLERLDAEFHLGRALFPYVVDGAERERAVKAVLAALTTLLTGGGA